MFCLFFRLDLRALRRQLALLAGATADRLNEQWFVWRTRQTGLLHAESTVTAATLERAIACGSRFLAAQQAADGALRGFCLYPGASTSWLTAHVCFVVEDLPGLETLTRRAAAYLFTRGADNGGWGYNERVAVDCDSWAQALLVLQRSGLPTPAFLLRNLAATQHPSGGFPTYPPAPGSTLPAHGWQSVHAEVSALVCECLRRDGSYVDNVTRCREWLDRQRDNGVLTSYWWRDDAYALWVQARSGLLDGDAAPAVRRALARRDGSPQLAMILNAAASLDGFEECLPSATRRLLAAQQADGSWPCAPCLRVTDPAYFDAVTDARGDVVADRRRVFSTAHAIAAVHQVKRRLYADAG